MDWLGDNVIALLALGLSSFALWLQRHRVTVMGSNTSVVHPPDHNVPYFLVSIRNRGRPVTVEHIRFETLNIEPGQQGVSWGAGGDDWDNFQRLGAIPLQSPVSRLMADGESLTWVTRLWAPDEALARTGVGAQVRVVVTLSTGKPVKSKPVWAVIKPPPIADILADRQ